MAKWGWGEGRAIILVEEMSRKVHPEDSGDDCAGAHRGRCARQQDIEAEEVIPRGVEVEADELLSAVDLR